jgi:hypothetical protein
MSCSCLPLPAITAGVRAIRADDAMNPGGELTVESQQARRDEAKRLGRAAGSSSRSPALT